MFLGINSFFHDSSASLVGSDGRILAAVEEERFTRKKREGRFPIAAIESCLKIAGIKLSDVRELGFPWHPANFLLQRILWSNFLHYPVRPRVLVNNVRKLCRIASVNAVFRREFGQFHDRIKTHYLPHHLAHAASAYYPSPFDNAAYLTLDGRGELEAITWGRGSGPRIQQLGRSYFPHSIGKLYSAVCRFLGFHHAQKDGTVMALAACGEPRFSDQFREILRIEPGRGLECIKLSRSFFNLQDKALPSRQMEKLLGVKVRQPNDPLLQAHKDVAASLQQVTQDAIMHLLCELHRLTRCPNAVLAGGVALNSVANGMILERTPFNAVFIQPAAHDAGLSLGAGLLLAHRGRAEKGDCTMTSASLGPSFNDAEIQQAIADESRLGRQLYFRRSSDIAAEVAKLIALGQVIAWFQGSLEFGPRALGNRSILADPRDPGIKDKLNRIKNRESFRPFAAAVLFEARSNWLCRGTESPFMLLVDSIHQSTRHLVPGVQHVDGTVRVQTVRSDVDPLFHRLINTFFMKTGIPMVLNTSLNVRGEPLACSPADALRVMADVPIDAIALGDYLVTRSPADHSEMGSR